MNSWKQMVGIRLLKSEKENHQAYSYDKRGNLTVTYKNNELTHQYHFGALNRLEKAFNFEQNLGATYRYSGFGHRVGKTEGQAIEPILPTTGLEPLNLNPTNQIDDVIDITRQYHNLLQRSENKSVTSYTWDSGILSAMGERGSAHHYLRDELGSSLRVFGETGLEQERFAYDELGNSLINIENPCSIENKNQQYFTYTGYQPDPISDTLFAQAREYSPATGRFISEDLVKGFTATPITLNPYVYCWNQPLTFVDLDGRIPGPPLPEVPAVQETGNWWQNIGNSLEQIEANITTPNTDQSVIFDSRISNYRGQVVVRLPGSSTSAASLGHVMVLGGGVEHGGLLITHEHGHFLEFRELGAYRYYVGIGIPSLWNNLFPGYTGDYFNQPWELNANRLAGLPLSECATLDDVILALLYYEHLKSIEGFFGNAQLFVDSFFFAGHDFSALRKEWL